MIEARLRELKEAVNEQAEDEGLWFVSKLGFEGDKLTDYPITAGEAYLQQALRELHRKSEALSQAIESAKTFDDKAADNAFLSLVDKKNQDNEELWADEAFEAGARWMHSQIFSPGVKSE